MTKADTLQAKLAKSLDRANKTAKKPPRPMSKPKPARKPRSQIKPPPPPQPGSAQKVSISLYPSDTAQIQAISLHLLQKGNQISASEAVRLALRTSTVDDKLLRVYEDMKIEDGRRK